MTYCGGDDGMKERDEVRESVPILVYKDGRLVCQGLSDIAKACGGHCKSGMSIETTVKHGKQQTMLACCLLAVLCLRCRSLSLSLSLSFVVCCSSFVQCFRSMFVLRLLVVCWSFVDA